MILHYNNLVLFLMKNPDKNWPHMVKKSRDVFFVLDIIKKCYAYKSMCLSENAFF